MIDLSNTVLYASVASTDEGYVDRTLRVLDWCHSLATWKHTVLFLATEPKPLWNLMTVQIPVQSDLPYGHGFQVFQARILPELLLNLYADHYFGVHEDGFPVEPLLWDANFLNYDWIGPAWPDGVVGGSGMHLRSHWMLEVVSELPFLEKGDHDDTWVCRTHRDVLIEKGVHFAPAEVANRFCTETVANDQPSFGFHGRTMSPEKYKRGWELIEAWEKSR